MPKNNKYEKPEKIVVTSNTIVTQRTSANDFSKSCVWVSRDNFYGTPESDDTFLIVGFDTEFKTPKGVTNEDIKAGRGKYEVLSYQAHCKLIDPTRSDAPEWGGVFYPEKDKRLSFSDLLTFAIWQGISSKVVDAVPRRVVLVGHFTRADLPALIDFSTLCGTVEAVRNTFVTLRDEVELAFKGKPVDFQELLRLEPDRGTTNVRNTSSKHWVRWLGPKNRCLVPMTSFSEPDQVGGTLKPFWFALDESEPIGFFAGIQTEWACVRKVKDGFQDCHRLRRMTGRIEFLATSCSDTVRGAAEKWGKTRPPHTFLGVSRRNARKAGISCGLQHVCEKNSPSSFGASTYCGLREQTNTHLRRSYRCLDANQLK